MQLSSDLKYCPHICLEEIKNTIKISSQDEVSALGIDTASLGMVTNILRHCNDLIFKGQNDL